jgi:hypothetical protein
MSTLKKKKGLSMSRGGKREGAGRPTRANREGKLPRIVLSCRVESETVAFLRQEEERTNKSIGKLVDLAIGVLKEHPEQLPPDAITDEEEETA